MRPPAPAVVPPASAAEAAALSLTDGAALGMAGGLTALGAVSGFSWAKQRAVPAGAQPGMQDARAMTTRTSPASSRSARRTTTSPR